MEKRIYSQPTTKILVMEGGGFCDDPIMSSAEVVYGPPVTEDPLIK